MENFEFAIISGKQRTSSLYYIISEKQLFRKKSTYKDVLKLQCYNNSCKSRMVLLADKKTMIKAKNYVDHNHNDQEDLYKQFQILNKVKKCVVASCSLLSDNNALSTIRASYRNVVSK